MCTLQRCRRKHSLASERSSLYAFSTSPRRSETRADRWPGILANHLLHLGLGRLKTGTLAQPRAESRLAECRSVDSPPRTARSCLARRLCRVKSWTDSGLCHPRIAADRTVQARKDLGWDCRRQRLSRISRSGLDCVGAPQRRGRPGPGSRLAAKHVVVGARPLPSVSESSLSSPA